MHFILQRNTIESERSANDQITFFVVVSVTSRALLQSICSIAFFAIIVLKVAQSTFHEELFGFLHCLLRGGSWMLSSSMVFSFPFNICTSRLAYKCQSNKNLYASGTPASKQLSDGHPQCFGAISLFSTFIFLLFRCQRWAHAVSDFRIFIGNSEHRCSAASFQFFSTKISRKCIFLHDSMSVCVWVQGSCGRMECGHVRSRHSYSVYRFHRRYVIIYLLTEAGRKQMVKWQAPKSISTAERDLCT